MSEDRSISRRGFLGAAAGAGGLLGASGTAAGAQATATSTATGNETTATATSGGGGGETHTVDMNDDLDFVPADITIAPGDTIEWVNVGEIPHTVTAYGDEIPDGAEYFASGGFDSEDAARNDSAGGSIGAEGTYSHTFETLGTYEYFCIPHEASGMTGTVTVEEPSDATATPPIVPDSAKTMGVAAFGGLVGVIALAYFFLKYGGGEAEAPE